MNAENLSFDFNENVAMPFDHKLIRDILRGQHPGAQRAICQTDLAAVSGIPKRKVRDIIKDLIEQFGQPIGTMYGKVGGYFWIENKTEADLTCKQITDACISGLARVAALKKITLRELVGQLDLGL